MNRSHLQRASVACSFLALAIVLLMALSQLVNTTYAAPPWRGGGGWLTAGYGTHAPAIDYVVPGAPTGGMADGLPIPRDGTLASIAVNATGNPNFPLPSGPIVLWVGVNDFTAPTPLQVTIPAGFTGVLITEANLPVRAGDRIMLVGDSRAIAEGEAIMSAVIIEYISTR